MKKEGTSAIHHAPCVTNVIPHFLLVAYDAGTIECSGRLKMARLSLDLLRIPNNDKKSTRRDRALSWCGWRRWSGASWRL